MKIAYILYWLEGPDSGVYRKVLNQAKFWIAAKNEVTVILAGPAEKEESYTKATTAIGATLKYIPLSGPLGRWLRWKRLKSYLRMESFDVIYHRFDVASPGLKAAVDPGRWVIEINTNDLNEYALNPGLKSFYNNISREGFFHRIAGSIFMTNELAGAPAFRALTGELGRARDASIVIANGIDFQGVAPSQAMPNDHGTELLFIGSDGQTWHGVDKLVALALAKPEWKIHAVGVSNAMFPNGHPANILTPGRMAKHEYERLASRCVAGVGTLGLHRKGMHEACPLKVREYLAYGLPVIIGYVDTDIPTSASYALHIPNTEENVTSSLPGIISFIDKWRGRRVDQSDVAHMGWAVKEEVRLNFLARFARHKAA